MYEDKSLSESKFTKIREFFTPENSSWLVFAIIILIGIIIRIIFWEYTSSDIFVWQDAANLLIQGENPYEYTITSFEIEGSNHFYAYMPLWMYICSLVLLIFPQSWFFIIIKISIIFFDLGVVFLLYLILKSKIENVWRLKISIALWFIAPMVLMTGAMHGKFDSLMFIFILSALYFHEQDKFIPETIFLSLGILTKTIVLMIVPFFFLKNIKKKQLSVIAYKIGLLIFPLILFSIPFLYKPVLYFKGILGVHITREHDLAPLFALLKLLFNFPNAENIIRTILTTVITLVWIFLIVISYIKNLDVYSSIFYSFLSFNTLYWVFLIQYIVWNFTFYTIYISKSKLKHWITFSLTSFLIISISIGMGLMGLFIKNGL